MISTSSVRIEVRTDKLNAWADTRNICSGFVETIQFTPEYGGAFYLCRSKEDSMRFALIIAPDEKWKQDIEDSGWTIIQEIKP